MVIAPPLLALCRGTLKRHRRSATASERQGQWHVWWHGTRPAMKDETARKGGMTRVDGRDTRDILDRHRVLRILLALVTVLPATRSKT